MVLRAGVESDLELNVMPSFLRREDLAISLWVADLTDVEPALEPHFPLSSNLTKYTKLVQEVSGFAIDHCSTARFNIVPLVELGITQNTC
jgi:hypothetical protein